VSPKVDTGRREPSTYSLHVMHPEPLANTDQTVARQESEAAAFLDIVTDEFVEDFRKLVALSPDQIRAIAKYVNTDSGFALADEDSIRKLIRESGVSTNRLTDVYKIAKFIFDRVYEDQISPNALLDAFSSLATKHDIPDLQERREALGELFTVKSTYRELKRVRACASAVVPRFESAATVQDVRAIFDDEQSDLLSLTPVALVEIKVEKNGEDDSFSFQTDEDGLDELVKILSACQKRLKVLRARVTAAAPVYPIKNVEGEIAK